MKSVEDLDVFKLAHQLALKIYSTTKGFPREEMLVWWTRCDGQPPHGMNGTKPLRLELLERGSGIGRKSLTWELRSGYDRVLQMLSRLSQTLGNVPRSR